MAQLMEAESVGDITIAGPCPGCSIWTLEYDRRVITSDWWSVDDFFDDVEFILQEHHDECPGLRELVARL